MSKKATEAQDVFGNPVVDLTIIKSLKKSLVRLIKKYSLTEKNQIQPEKLAEYLISAVINLNETKVL